VALSRAAIEAMAPDQAALKSAAGLLKPAKWTGRGQAGELFWGECQGSGANPYRVCAYVGVETGSKCTCPSRKFPCKHALALMWLSVDEPGGFAPADAPPSWVNDWMGRRRSGAAPPPGSGSTAGKSIDAATAAPVELQADPVADARRAAAAAKRADDTRSQVAAGLDELETWIADQLRTGLGGLLAEVSERCRRMAARLVDAKAGALASRLDEAPSRLLSLPATERADAAVAELGKLVLLTRAWRAAPDDPELHREIVSTEARELILVDGSPGLRCASTWDTLAERIATRRDGLVSVATWLLNLGDGPRFALLLDFFPASAGRRSGAFVAGQRLVAELAFYPSRTPLRAVIVSRQEAIPSAATWPQAAGPDPLAAWRETLLASPWTLEAPLFLPAGRLCAEGAGPGWWRSEQNPAVGLPLAESPPPAALGARLSTAIGLWNGARLDLMAADSDWGRQSFDG
jgi:hypothetical protein